MTGSDILKKTVALAVVFCSAAINAQYPAQLRDGASGPDVVVTGKPEPTEKQAVEQAKAISRVGDVHQDPLARFSDPICPGVLGLPEDAAGIIADRIRYDAERVGAPVSASTDCKANILIVFTRDGGAEVRKLIKTRGYLFDGLETSETRELQIEPGPVRAWNVTQTRNRHGQEQSGALAVPGMVSIDSNPGLGPLRVIVSPNSSSHIFLASRLDITASVVIMDLAALDGLPVVQIADYAAMRSLARTRPAKSDAAASTILSLFDPAGQPPREITSFDLAYLRSLYDAGSNVKASAKILDVARMLEKGEALATKDAAADP